MNQRTSTMKHERLGPLHIGSMFVSVQGFFIKAFPGKIQPLEGTSYSLLIVIVFHLILAAAS